MDGETCQAIARDYACSKSTISRLNLEEGAHLIEDNEFLDLPDDPEEGFAVLRRRLANALEKAYEDNNAGGWHLERRYVDTLVAYDEVHNLGLLQSLSNPPTGDQHFSDFYQLFRRHAEIISQKIRIKSARRHKLNAASVVVLDASTRAGLHQLCHTAEAE